MKYKAFISYSHATDLALFPTLQHTLETFGKKWYQIRRIRLFRDETNLTATPSLWSSIESALQESEYFIFLASPKAASSKWVQKEISWWLKNKDKQKFLIILTDGELAWDDEKPDFDVIRSDVIPETLLNTFADEPLYVGLRWAKGLNSKEFANTPRFQDGIATLAAVLLQEDKDDLIGYNAKQKLKRHRFVQCELRACNQP